MSIRDAQLEVIRQALAADGLICHVRGAEVRAIIARLDEAEANVCRCKEPAGPDVEPEPIDVPVRPKFTGQCLRQEHGACGGVVFLDQGCACWCHQEHGTATLTS